MIKLVNVLALVVALVGVASCNAGVTHMCGKGSPDVSPGMYVDTVNGNFDKHSFARL